MNLKNFPKRLDSKTSSLRIAVPENLDLALEGLIRKVLREQPKTDDIYSFAADYFETLLKIRDKAGAKFTAAQLCPFHNDEDAHEMIKLAGTFPKPAPVKLNNGKVKKPAQKKEADAKLNKRTKPKGSVKAKQPVKQVTPDLIKKLPTDARPEAEVEGKTRTSDAQGHDSEEATSEKEEEFLMSDPIKELVEKELMMEAGKNKTDGKDKTGNQNAQEEGKPLENVTIDSKEKHQEKEESEATNTEVETKEKTEEAENEKTELSKINEEEMKDAEASEKAAEEVKTDSENSAKEETDKTMTTPNEETTGETQKENEEVVISENEQKEEKHLSETVTELPNTVEVHLKEGNKNAGNKETNKKMETFPVSESGKKVMNVLPSKKLPEISEDVTEKNTDTPRTESDQQEETSNTETSPTEIKPQDAAIQDGQPVPGEQQPEPNNIDIPKETKPEEAETKDKQQPNDNRTAPYTEEVPKSVQVALASIPEHISLELSPDRATEAETDVASGEEKENEKTEEAKQVNDAQPTGDNEQSHMENQEEEAEEHKKNAETASRDEQPKETTVEEPKPEHSFAIDEDKTFGEIVKENEEEEITEAEPTEEIKSKEAEKPEETTTKDEEIIPEENTTKPQESTKPTVESTDEPAAPNEKVETTAEENITDNSEKPAEPTESTQAEDKTPEISDSDTGESTTNKTEKEGKDETANTEVNRDSDNQQTETSTKTTHDVLVTLQAQPETSEMPEKSIPTVQKEEEPKTTPEKSEVQENIDAETQGDELCSVVDIKQVPGDDMSTEKPEGEAEPDKPEVEGAQTVEVKTEEEEVVETKEEKQTEEGEVVETKEEKQEEAGEVVETKEEKQAEEQEVVETKDEKPAEEGEVVETKDEKQAEEGEVVETKEEKQAEEQVVETKEEKQAEEQEVVETEEEKAEELCTVVDVPKEGETVEKSENMQMEEAEELCRVVDNPTDEVKTQSETEKAEIRPEMKEETNDSAAEDNTDSEKPRETTPDIGEGQESIAERQQTDTQHTIRVEDAEIPTKPEEIQIKTIQTHYYDTLQVPETVTREYRVHNVAPPTAASLLGAANILQPNILDENMNSTPSAEPLENLDISPPPEETMENVPTTVPTEPSTPEQVQETDSPAPVLPLDLETQTHKTDSDDLLDLMTPTSGYSMNLSDVSMLTVSELFLDSEKRYSSLEKEEIHYVTPKTSETADERQEVEEVIEKTVLSSNIAAVPVPPREAEEISEEANLENVKEEKKEEDKPDKQEDKPENDSTEGSSNERSVDSDIPFISVEVKTVIETQVLDDDDDEEEEKNGGERPEVEVTVRATIDVQDEQQQPEQISLEEGNVTSDEKSQEKEEEKSSAEVESKDQDEEMPSAGMEGSSSLDSDITTSSAATEIKRTDSSRRNLSSVRSLVSTQSLDLDKRNPLVKTRSLSSFRHGVTDFEVWNKIEKELEDAAIKIQSKFRGYKTRKKLQRENAVQITTEESSVSTTPVEAEAKDEGQQQQQQQQQSTGEFHDSIILPEHPR